MHPAYYHLAHACILCFDVTRKQTYKNLPDWHSELVGDGAYPRGRHRPSSPPGVTEGAGRTYAPTAERSLGGSVAQEAQASRSLSLERPRDADLPSPMTQLSRLERAGTGSCESSDKGSQWYASETRSTSTRRWRTSLTYLHAHVHLLATRSSRRSRRRSSASAPVQHPPTSPYLPYLPLHTLTHPDAALHSPTPLSPYTPYLPLQVTQKEFGFPKKHNLEVHAATTRPSLILFSPQPQPQSKPQSHPPPPPPFPLARLPPLRPRPPPSPVLLLFRVGRHQRSGRL